jgi:hypothetical protein
LNAAGLDNNRRTLLAFLPGIKTLRESLDARPEVNDFLDANVRWLRFSETDGKTLLWLRGGRSTAAYTVRAIKD